MYIVTGRHTLYTPPAELIAAALTCLAGATEMELPVKGKSSVISEQHLSWSVKGRCSGGQDVQVIGDLRTTTPAPCPFLLSATASVHSSTKITMENCNSRLVFVCVVAGWKRVLVVVACSGDLFCHYPEVNTSLYRVDSCTKSCPESQGRSCGTHNILGLRRYN